jgi:hypothetical protein
MNLEKSVQDKAQTKVKTIINNEDGGIVVPVILWWLGAPLALVIVLWLLFFR